MDSLLGIDKLQLLLPTSEISFRPDFPATVDKPINAATGEYLRDRALYNADGLEVTGAKAYYNTPNFNLSIVPHREAPSSLVIVHFSGGAYSDNNLSPMNLDECLHAARALQSDLAKAGCDFDVMKAKITRIDLARNVELSHPVASYSSAFAAINCRKRVKKQDYGATGFMAGNKQWEFNGYDKGAEMREKGTELAACPENTLRAEMRYLKSSTVRAATGCESLTDLRSNWPGFKAAYVESLERDVFKAKTEANIDRSIALHQLAAFVRESGVKRTEQAFATHLGRMQLVMLVGAEEAKRFIAEEFDYDASTDSGKRQIARVSAMYDAVNFSLKMQESTTQGALVKELYRELQQRVLNF